MNSSEVVTPQPPSDIEQQQQKKATLKNETFYLFIFASISANAAITFRFFSTLSTRP